jgi:hypothetical protein
MQRVYDLCLTQVPAGGIDSCLWAFYRHLGLIKT